MQRQVNVAEWQGSGRTPSTRVVLNPITGSVTLPAGLTDEELARMLQEEEEQMAAAEAASRAAPPPAPQGGASGSASGRQGGSSSGSASLPLESTVVALEASPLHPPGGRRATPAPATSRAAAPLGGNGVFVDDAAYAAALQQAEIMMAAQADVSAGPDPDAEGQVLEDPVWGKYRGKPGKPLPPMTVLCVSMCPCCVPPCCSAERKVAYRKVGRTAVFWLSLVQALLWIVSLCFRGFAPTSINPMLGPWPDTLNVLQAKNAAEIIYNIQIWRFVTPIFLHAGLIHLATNLAMQLRMGLYLEVTWGTKKFLVVYFVSGILASMYSAVCLPDKIGVGASGALMGTMGAWLVQLLASWSAGDASAQQQRTFSFLMCVVNILVVIGFSFVPYVDYAAHLFGLLGGLLSGAYLFAGAVADPLKRRVMRLAAPSLYLTLVLIAILVLYTSLSPAKWLLYYCQQMAVEAAASGYSVSC